MNRIEKAKAEEKEVIQKARAKRRAIEKAEKAKEAKKFAKIDQKVGAIVRRCITEKMTDKNELKAFESYIKEYRWNIDKIIRESRIVKTEEKQEEKQEEQTRESITWSDSRSW